MYNIYKEKTFNIWNLYLNCCKPGVATTKFCETNLKRKMLCMNSFRGVKDRWFC